MPSTVQIPVETWKPAEINDFDEMERLQSLKQRENLLKGMGIIDFVNKILFGTSGTVATLPPSFLSSNNQPSHENEHSRNIVGNSKLEIRTKNYNPFENHSLFTEVILEY